jgi:stress-induced morphogen
MLAAVGRRALGAGAALAQHVRALATSAETDIAAKIRGGLSAGSSVEVEDTSGGCGTFYRIKVVAEDFRHARWRGRRRRGERAEPPRPAPRASAAGNGAASALALTRRRRCRSLRCDHRDAGARAS